MNTVTTTDFRFSRHGSTPRPNRGLLRYSVIGLMICVSSEIASAGLGRLTVGAPGGNGSVDVDVSIPGITPFGTVSGQATRVRVTGIKSTDTAAQKAAKVAVAINLAYGAPPNVATISGANSSRIDLAAPAGTPKAGQAGVASIAPKGDKTHEGNLLAQVDIPSTDGGIRLTGLIGYDTDLSGLDANGAISTFTASIGYAGLTDTVTLSFNQLSAPTVDALTTDIFNQLSQGLPASLRSDLSLDLLNDQILFNFPGSQTDYFVQSVTTDTGVELSGGLAYSVPLPSTVSLVGAGLIAFFPLRWLARKAIA